MGLIDRLDVKLAAEPDPVPTNLPHLLNRDDSWITFGGAAA